MTDIFNNTYIPAPAFGDIELDKLRADVWVNANVDGTSDSSYGVSSLTDSGTGLIGVNFTYPFFDSDFVAVGNSQLGGGFVANCVQITSNLSSSRSDFQSGSTAAGDPTEYNIIIFGHNA